MATNTNTEIVDVKTKYDDTGLGKFRNSLKDISAQIPLLSLGIAGMAGAFVKFSIDAFKAGAAFEELRSNFIGSAKDIELFRKATAGTVSDKGLIELSNYASDLGVSLQDQALLFSLAEDAADKYGGTVEENFNRVINATDGSAKGLRAVGIGVKEYNEKLKDLLPTSAKTIDDLDSETQQNLRLQAIIKLKGITLEDVNQKQQSNADIIDNLATLYETFTVNVGLAINQNIKLGDSFTGLTGKSEAAGKAVGDFFAEGLSRISSMIKQDIKEIEKLKNVFENLVSFVHTMDSLSIAEKLQFLANGGLSMINTNPSGYQFQYGNDNAYPVDIQGNPIISHEAEKSFTVDKKPKSLSSKGSSEVKEKVEKLAIELILEAVQNVGKDYNVKNFIQDNIKISQDVAQPYNNFGIENVNKLLGGTDIKPYNTGLSMQETFDKSKEVFDNVQSLFGLLNAGTDTFIGKMLGFFNTINSILQAFSLVKSIIGIIGTFASGGAALRPGTSGSGNIYLGLDLNTMQVYKQGRQQFLQRQNQIRVS